LSKGSRFAGRFHRWSTGAPNSLVSRQVIKPIEIDTSSRPTEQHLIAQHGAGVVREIVHPKRASDQAHILERLTAR
jgi:hypothetical protein